MNTASVALVNNESAQIPFNFVVCGSDAGRLAFNPMTSVFTVPQTGLYRIFLDVTFIISSAGFGDQISTDVQVNERSQSEAATSLAATVGVAGTQTLQNLYTGTLIKGDVVTFTAYRTTSGTVSLAGVAVPNVLPFPVLASFESLF